MPFSGSSNKDPPKIQEIWPDRDLKGGGYYSQPDGTDVTTKNTYCKYFSNSQNIEKWIHDNSEQLKQDELARKHKETATQMTRLGYSMESTVLLTFFDIGTNY